MASTGKAKGIVDLFIINDIELTIAPTDIHISKNSVNYQWQTLRTKTSQKTKSGHSSIDIEFTVAFVGADDINEKLRPLIAQLRYMPFCFADNAFLRQTLFPQEFQEAGAVNTKDTITLAIRGISISIRSETPNTVWATFQFSYFNYSPYTPMWQYKKDLFGIDSQKFVSSPINSLAWQKFVAPSINETSTYEGGNSNAVIKFLELRTAPISDVSSLEQSRSILQQLQNNPKDFLNTIRDQVLNTPEATLRNAVVKNLSGFSGLNSIAASDVILPIVLDASARSNPNSASFDRSGNFINQDALKQAMAQLDDRINAKLKAFDQTNETAPDGFVLVDQLIGRDNRGQGFGVFKRLRGIDLNPDENIIITGITVSIQNILATIPILGQRYATFQHIGSIDASVSMDMKVTSEDGLKNLSWFYDTVNENMLTNRHIPQGMQTIRIENNFLGLFNLSEFVTNDMHIDTIPGQPGTYDVKLMLTESGLKHDSTVDSPEEKFRSEFGSSDPAVIKAIVATLVKNIKLITVGGKPKFISAVTDPRSSRLDNIVTKFCGSTVERSVKDKVLTALRANPFEQIDSEAQSNSLNGFALGVFNIIKDDQSFHDPLFSLNENDIPGITKVQEYIAQRKQELQQVKTNDANFRKSFFSKILTGEIPLQSSTAGTQNASANVITNKPGTVAELVAKPAFVAWNESISSLTTDVIEGPDLELPEFSQIKSMVHGLGLNRGLPAYPDFQFERLVNDDIDKLLSLDPDCFLFSSIDSSIDDFIDPALIANAKLIANNSYNTALDQVSKYYKSSWLPNSISSNIRDKVIANIKSGVSLHGSDDVAAAGDDVDRAYYRGNIKIGDYYNATSQIGNRTIEVGASTIDSQQIHASTSEKIQLQCANPPIMHSLDPGKLTSLSSGNVLIPSTQQPGTPEPNSKGSDFAGGAQIFKPVDGELRIAGPTGGFSDVRTSAEFGASQSRQVLVASHGRLHNGVDIKADLGSNVYAVADGSIVRIGWDRRTPTGDAAGFAVILQHSDRTRSFYFHLVEPTTLLLRAGDKVKGGQVIGNVGRTAVGNPNTPTHLHMEFHDEVGIAIDPGQYMAITSFNGKKNIAVANYGPKNGPVSGVTAGSSVMDFSIQNFHASLRNGQGMRLVRAFPTFKLYFIQDDSANRRRYGMDDFFSYNSVAEITCVRSRKIPADLVDITVTNVSGILSNRKFQGPRKITNEKPEGDNNGNSPVDAIGNKIDQDPNGFLKKDSKFENPIASLMLQPGIDVELRLGYSNDPDKLTTVFTGKIMEVEFSESDDLIRITCQSHAIELVQDIKGMDKPIEKDGWFINDARTDRVLESMMSEPEVIHFGRWIRSKTVAEGNSNRDLLTNKFSLTPSPQDDNIFVPPIEKLNELDDGWFFKNLKYSIFRTTIWDIFDEMTLRHPGWIKSAVPYKGKYGPRMTMFFGLPSQLYFAADPSAKEKLTFSNTVNNYQSTNDKLRNNTFIFNPDNFENDKNNYLQGKQVDRDFTAERLELAKDFQSIKPFRAYHLVTSKNHIIANNIRASSKGTFNTVSIQYGQGKFNKETQQLIQDDYDILTLSIDAALPDEDIREIFVQYNNCQHKLLAKKYAVSLLIRQLKEVYRGELVIVGNPDIKPHDIVYIFDDYSDLMGPVEVEQVVHRFSQDTGFITEITPDLFVVANEWVNMTATDLMSVIIEGTTSTFTNGAPTFTEGAGSAAKGAIAAGVVGLALLSPLAAIVAGGLAVGGYFMLKKMVDFTSHGQPVVIHPLIHRGVPFVAGLPMAKLNNLWDINKGQWFKEGFEGISMALEDFNDKLTLAPSQGNLINLFSGNTIPPKF